MSIPLNGYCHWIQPIYLHDSDARAILACLTDLYTTPKLLWYGNLDAQESDIPTLTVDSSSQRRYMSFLREVRLFVQREVALFKN